MVFQRLKSVVNIGDRSTEVIELVHISMYKGCKGSVRLSFGSVDQEGQFVGPLVNFIGNELLHELIGAERGTKMRSAL